MKQRRSRLLALFMAAAMTVGSFTTAGFAEEAGTLAAESLTEETVQEEELFEEPMDSIFEDSTGAEEEVFETEYAPETEARTDTETVPAEDVFVDEDGLIEDESPEETLEPETEAEMPEEEAETEGEEDLLISDEEPETETLTEEETEELTESETDILEEENLGADLVSGSWTYTVSGSYATITGYTGTATTISIPTTVEGKTVTAIKYGAFANNTKLKSVSIPATVNAIGSSQYDYTGAFEGCKNLTTVTINAGSGMAFIGRNTFKNCVSLSKIVIPGNYYQIKDNAFYGCSALQSMEYKAGSYSQSIGTKAFADCTNLTTAIIPSTVATIGNYAFENDTKLSSLTLNEGLLSIGYGAFGKCTKLPSVVVPSTVTAIGSSQYDYEGAFEDCKNLTAVTLKAGTGNAVIGRNSFEGCVSLKSIVIPGNYYAVKSDAFRGCTALQRMEYKASSSSYANQSISENAFNGCSSLTTAIIPGTVSSIGNYAFESNTNLTSLTLSEGLQTIGYGAFGKCIKLPSVVIPSTVTALGSSQYDYEGAFEGCSKLAAVTLKAGTDDAVIGRNSFEGCVSLKSIVIPGNYYAVKSDAFKGCTALQRMEYKASSSSYANQSIGENAFNGCSSLATAIIPGTVSSIGNYAFESNTNLTSLTLNEGLQTIGYGAFGKCIKLPSVVIPSTVTALGSSQYDYEGAFEGCSKLAAVTLKAGTDDAVIGRNTFEKCVSLKSIVIPGNYYAVKSDAFKGCTALQRMEYKASSSSYANQSISENAFNGCSGLTTVAIPGTVSSIGNYAFENSTSLTGLTLGEGIETIGYGAFAGASKLSTVTIPSTVRVIGSVKYDYTGAFENCVALSKVTIKKNTNGDECSLGRRTFKGCISLSYVYIPSTYTTFSNSDIFANRGIALSIWGEWGSAAETFADANDIPFNRQGLQLGEPDHIQAINRASQIEVRWDTVEYADQYVVLRKTGSSEYKEIAKVKTNRYYDSGVTAGTTYEYTVKAMYNNMSGTYRTNGSKIFRLDMPIVRSVVNVSSGLQITWNQVSHAKSYVIYRRTLNGSYSTVATVSAGRGTYIDTSVRNNAGAGYRYTVRALSGAPVTSVSDCRECSAIRLLTPSLSVSNVTKGVQLNWNKITGASGYAVYRKTKNTAYTKIATVNSRDVVTYKDTSVKSHNGSAYIYTVRAINGNSISVGMDKSITRLTSPSITGLTNSASRKLTCKWSSNAKATKYQLQYATNSSFSGAKTVSVGKKLKYTLSGLTKGKRYYVRVRVVRTVGSATYYSAWSSYSSIKISK